MEKIPIGTNYFQYKQLEVIGLWQWPSSLVLKRDIIDKSRNLSMCDHPMDNLLGIAILNYGGCCVYFDLPLTGYRIHGINDSISLLSVSDIQGLLRWTKTRYKYWNGYKAALVYVETFSLPAKVMIRKFLYENSIQLISTRENKVVTMVLYTIIISVNYIKKSYIDLAKENVGLNERTKWLFNIVKKLPGLALESLRLHFKAKMLTRQDQP